MNTVMTWLNSTGPLFCRHAFWMLLQTGILFGILWTIDRLLRRRVKASFRYALWLLILIKLLLPADLTLPSGIGYWFRLPAEKSDVMAEYIPNFDSPPVAQTKAVADIPQNTPPATTAPQVVPARRVTPAVTQPPVKLSLAGILFGLWILGAACLTAALLYQIWYVRRIRSHSRPVSDAVQDLFAQCRSHIGLKRAITLKQSDDMPSPAVCGLWRPTVLVPSSLVDKLEPEKLRPVLLHELGHIQRNDLWVNMIQTILQLFYFYNPFVRLANHWIRRTREQANDEHVLLHLDGRRQDYSATLVEIASAALARPALAMRMIGVAEPKTQLHERITLIMKKPLPKNSKTGVLGIAALLIFALLLLPMAAGPRALAKEMLAEVKPLTREQAIEQEKTLVANMIKSFNDSNLDGFVSAYAVDTLFLTDQDKIAVGTLGLKMALMSEFNKGAKVLDHVYTYHEMWSCGQYVVAATQDKVTFKFPSVEHMITALRNYLTVYRVQPDGTMNIKIQGVNMADLGMLTELPKITEETTFHRIESAPLDATVLNEEIEKVKKLDIEFHECFNRHDLDAAAKYYTDDAILMTVNRSPIHGAEAIKAYIVEGSQGMEHINNNQQIIHAEGNDQMVIIVNQFGWIFKVLETGETMSIPGKGIHIWFKQPDGQWKLQLDIHNTNVPLS